MPERKNLVTLHGNPVTLVGSEVDCGDSSADAAALDADLNEVKLSSFREKVLLLSTVPSLDTPVCSIETKRFNEEAAALGPDVEIVTVSMDLPFAQKRWCQAEGVQRVRALSDHRDAAVGMALGVLIKELRLLARAVFVIDRKGVVRYTEIVREVADEPDYDAALAAVREVLS